MNITPVVLMQHLTDNSPFCHALCLESDCQELFQKQIINTNVEIVHESIFRAMYPNAYAHYVRRNTIDCIAIWIEELFGGQRDFQLDDDALFAELFCIAVNDRIVTLTLYFGCDAMTAANLSLMLKERLPSESNWTINVHQCFEFVAFNNN